MTKRIVASVVLFGGAVLAALFVVAGAAPAESRRVAAGAADEYLVGAGIYDM